MELWKQGLSYDTKYVGTVKKQESPPIEVDKELREFKVGDESNREALCKLMAFSLQVNNQGHQPHLSQVLKPVSNKDKEDLCEHAEKLSIALDQGLQSNVNRKGPLDVSCNLDGIPLKQPVAESIMHLPSYDTLLQIVLHSRSSKNLLHARQTHTSICINGLEGYCSVGNHIVPMFVDCGSIINAQQAFNRLLERNEHSWTALISGYIHYGDVDLALSLYPLMDEDKVSSGPHTFMALLKACAEKNDANGGHELHAQIVHKGYEDTLFIGTTLVSFYTKCGLLFEARKVFDKLASKGVESWTALILGYVNNGQSQEALNCFEQMKQEGMSPNAHTYSCVLKACSITNNVHKGQEIHEEIRRKGFEADLFVGSTLVGLYTKCGLLSEAWEAFDRLRARDVVLWTTLIAGIAEYGHGQDALDCFNEMQAEDTLPTPITYACILKACGTVGAIERGRELHIEILKKGLSEEPSVANSLISMYAKCGSLPEAQYVFDKLPTRDVVSWNSLITGYSEHGPQEQALDTFDQMLLMCCPPDAITFSGALHACTSLGAIEKGQEIHGLIKQSEFETDLSVCNTLVGMYAARGLVIEAEQVFDKMPCKSTVSWNALIAGYAGHGLSQEALDHFHHMWDEQAIPDNITYSSVLKACGSIGALDEGQEIHTEITKRGAFDGDPYVCNGLVSLYATCGSLLEAQEAFAKLTVRDTIAWSMMIKCFGMNHKDDLAIQCFDDMQKDGVNPDAITFTCLLTVCCHASLIQEAKEYFILMREKYHIRPSVQHYNSLVNLLSRTGHLFEAEKYIEMLGCTSEETWVSILSACKTYGEVELGLRSFGELVRINAEDSAWYVLMADLYVSVGWWNDAYRTEELRRAVGAKKLAAVARIEVDRKVHKFTVGDEPTDEMIEMLNDMRIRVKKEGHVPHVDSVLKPVSEGEEEAVVCAHAEKLAIAFGLLNTPQGTTLRVSKNLRMCYDCHSTAKIIAKVEKREIILRDSCCVHHFRDNICSCGDMF